MKPFTDEEKAALVKLASALTASGVPLKAVVATLNARAKEGTPTLRESTLWAWMNPERKRGHSARHAERFKGVRYRVRRAG